VPICVTDTDGCLIPFVLELVMEHFVNVTCRKSYKKLEDFYFQKIEIISIYSCYNCKCMCFRL